MTVMVRMQRGGAAWPVALVAALGLLALVGCGGDGGAAVQAATDQGTWRKLPKAPGAERRQLQELTAQNLRDAVVLVAGVDDDPARFRGLGYDSKRVGGLKYDLDERRWRPVRGAPLWWRVGYAAAAVGDQIIVWGGTSNRGNHVDGARYDVGDDRWRKLAPSPLGARYDHSAVSTGDEVIFFGGARESSSSSSRAGAIYAPADDRWRRIPRAPLEGRRNHVAVWTGDAMIVWGGYAGERGVPRGRFADGAAFDPVTGAWKPIADAPVRASEHTVGLWLGDRLFVFNGSRAALYDPGADEWRLAAAPPLPKDGFYEGVWTGERVLVWGTGKGRGRRGRGAAYDPARDAWTPLAEAPLGGRGGHAALWTRHSLLIWGGCCNGEDEFVDGAEYFPDAAG